MKNGKSLKTALIVSGAVTALICGVMNLWLLPAIEATTEGLRCFDMNSFGYTAGQAQRFLSLLSERGRDLYLRVQLPLDFIYPIAYGAFFMLAIRALKGKRSAWFALPAALAAADYTENVCSVIMLQKMEAAPALARFASAVTVLKSGLMAAAFLLLAVLLVIWLVKKKRRPKNA